MTHSRVPSTNRATGRRFDLLAVALASWVLLSGCGVAVRMILPDDLSCARSGRYDRIFRVEKPILFAHRGGVLEAPESTEMAFCHAVRHAGADVLETDVQQTRDKRFVVWHGPSLDNVRIENQPLDPCERNRREISDYDWDELDGTAWVADPRLDRPCCGALDEVPQEANRQLMLLSTFLAKFPCQPLNIELKETVEKDDIPRFQRILAAAPPCAESRLPRSIVVVSLCESLLSEVRASSTRPTGYSLLGNLLTVVRSWFLWLPYDMRGRALQTSGIWLKGWLGRTVIDRVHCDGGAVHVFVSKFLGHALDDEATEDNAGAIRKLIALRADGIMTDRPRWVHALPEFRERRVNAESTTDGGHDEGRCGGCTWRANEIMADDEGPPQ